MQGFRVLGVLGFRGVGVSGFGVRGLGLQRALGREGKGCQGKRFWASSCSGLRAWCLGKDTVDDINPAMTLRTLNYGNYGILLIMGNAGVISSTVGLQWQGQRFDRTVFDEIYSFWNFRPLACRNSLP